jgi:pimeloyl-ACP methyl ester carboxylesterase
MLQAAEWFADQELLNVRRHLDDHPGYSLLLVGHSLGAGAPLRCAALCCAALCYTPYTLIAP